MHRRRLNLNVGGTRESVPVLVTQIAQWAQTRNRIGVQKFSVHGAETMTPTGSLISPQGPIGSKGLWSFCWETGLSLFLLGACLIVLDEDSALASVAAITKYY